MSLRLLLAKIETMAKMSEYKEAMKKAKQMDIAINAMFPTPQIGPYPPYPNFDKRVQGFIEEVKNFKGDKNNVAVCFGDSLTDMYRDRFQSIDICMACSGMHHYHMAQMAQTMFPCLAANGIVPKYVMVGTLGGNPLLQHQEINSVIQKSIEALQTIRGLFPLARFIVYGLPPVVSVYATVNSLHFESAMFDWVVKDSNAVFIPLQKKFGTGFLGLTPKSYCTSDGVHLSPYGMVLLDELFEKAKKAPPRTIVD